MRQALNSSAAASLVSARRLPGRRWLVPALLAALGLWQLGAGGWIHLKAELAQYLLARAWQQSLAEGQPVRPWPWADTWPLGTLTLGRQAEPLMVLQGDSGRTLAFGPGHAPGSAMPGEAGTILISGHRDTHFAALEDLAIGDPVRLRGADRQQLYRVVETRIVDSRQWAVADTGDSRLMMVTCYPFDSPFPGGPLRYVVSAEPIPRRSAGPG